MRNSVYPCGPISACTVRLGKVERVCYGLTVPPRKYPALHLAYGNGGRARRCLPRAASSPLQLLSHDLQIVQFCIGAGVAWRTYPALLRPEGWLENEAQVGGVTGMTPKTKSSSAAVLVSLTAFSSSHMSSKGLPESEALVVRREVSGEWAWNRNRIH